MKIFKLEFGYFSYFCSKHTLLLFVEPTRQGSSNEYPQSMFLSGNKKNNVYPYKPQFHYIKVGLRGSTLNRLAFVMRLHGSATPLPWTMVTMNHRTRQPHTENCFVQWNFHLCLFHFITKTYLFIYRENFASKN